MTIATGSLIEVVLNQSFFNQTILNVYQYEVLPPVGEVGAVEIGNAWWANMKAAMRAFAVAGAATFMSVKVRELDNPVGAYGEYAIPSAEQPGTRVAPAQAEFLPIFNAASLRLVVGSRATRPGHKRIAYLTESDNVAGTLQSAFAVLMAAWGVLVSNPITLGAPAALTVLNPIICKKNATGSVISHQPVTGFIVAAQITTQNTRKIGRGV